MRALFPALAALFIIIGVPVGFLSLPAAGFFLPVALAWVVVTSFVIGVGWLVFGRKGVLATSGLFFAIFAWAIGKAVIGPGMSESARCSESAAIKLQPPLTTRPARVVLDNVERTMPYHNGHLPVIVAVVTGAEVVEIGRLARGHIGAAWSTKASPGPDCTAPGSRNTIETGGRGQKQQKLDLCLTTTKLLEYSQRQTKTLDFADAAPTIVITGNADYEDTGRRKCDVFEVYEDQGSTRRQLGRFIYDWRDRKLHPDPRKPDSRDSGFSAIIKAVLGDQVSDDALKPHFVY